MIRSLLVLSIQLILCITVCKSAPITYVDAIPGVSGNTTLANGSLFTPPGNGNNGVDNNWELRAETAFGTNGTILESGGETGGGGGPADDAPRIRTTIRDLEPGAMYDVFGFFWANETRAWRINMSLQNSRQPLPGWIGNDNFGSSFNHANAVNANANAMGAFTAPPLNGGADTNGFENTGHFANGNGIILVESDDRDLYQAPLGRATASPAGTIDVFVDDLPPNATSNRTWYDGVGYVRIPEPSSPALALLACFVQGTARLRIRNWAD